MWELMLIIIPSAIAYTMPLLMGALGGLYSERSGVTNLCIEGLMLFGCFASAATIVKLQAIPGFSFNLAIVIGILVAMVASTLLAALHAIASINLKADQTISGTAINMLSTALSLFLAQTITGSGNITVVRAVIRSDVPILSKIPVLGPLFFSETYWTTWICIAVWVISYFLLYKTSFGLRLRACGEHPSAVASAGVNVHKMRYIGVLTSGLLSGLGGACILVTYAGEYNAGSGINGLGFLAIAALIFGQWKPLGILGSTAFFGLCMTIANIGRILPAFSGIPMAVLGAFPYIATLIALIFSSKKSAAPLASGQPF
ncbi:MAG: ABC transporter permease [Spirochaetales bacterium]|uniref:ABC transporter permease n=1 Tax=Bullifex sp. TaxID=2815808 RepID=UPI002A5814F8|nr:ABC transporter permease [Bullifex sp.]MDD5973902.1 ABC transporter permease [Spirochaetales bacterium]MDD7270733.1 ABC transporter permease [Spirochaetales bacterium]MDY4066128.1 ABC transporter permease [Bullifex sp.]